MRHSSLKRFKAIIAIILTFAIVTNSLPITAFANSTTNSRAAKHPTSRPTPKNSFPKTNGKPVELKTRRTTNSRQYLNPDGTFTVETSIKPLHYKDKRGKFELIDNELIQSDKPGYSNKNKANSFKVHFANDNKDKHLVMFNIDEDHWLSFSPIEKYNGIGQKNNPQLTKTNGRDNPRNSKMKYPNYNSYMDIDYSVVTDGLKEEIILKKYPKKNTFIFEFASEGLNYEKQADGTIRFTDVETGEELFHFIKSFAVDANEDFSFDVNLEIVGNQLILTVDDEWLQNAAYPVIIDPTIVVNTSPTNNEDVVISSGHPNETLNWQWLHAGKWDSSDYYNMRSLVRFAELPKLPAGAKITEAYLDMYMYRSTSTASQIDVHKITSQWNVNAVTWNTHPQVDWTPVASKSSTAIGSWQFDISQTVKQWYEGEASNYGLMIKAQNDSDDRRSWYSGDRGDGKDMPSLIVTYQVDPYGTESFWGFAGNVNVHTGNFVVSGTDVTLPGKGVPIVVSRTYNSRASSQGGSPYGYGWSYNVDMNIQYADDGSSVMVTDGDGTKHYFVKDKNGDYLAPVGMYWTLTKEGNIYFLEDKSGTKYYFDSNGKLDKAVDTDDNLTDFAYESGRLKTITDPSLRTVTFNYNAENRLQTITGAEIPTVTYDYYPNGDLKSVTKADGQETQTVTFGYDDAGLPHYLTSVTDGENNVTSISYIPTSFRVDKITKTLDNNKTTESLVTDYSYAWVGEYMEGTITTVLNPKGDITEYTTNGQGNVVKIVQDPTGLNIKNEYDWDEYQNLTEIIEPNGADHNTVIHYNNTGDPTMINNAYNNTALYKYNSNSDVINSVDFAGRTKVNSYDSDTRNVVASSNPLFSTSVYRYTDDGNTESVTVPLGIGENMLPNTGFESWSGNSPVYWNNVGQVTAVSDQSEKVSGKYSVKVTSNSDSERGYLYTDLVNVEPSSVYNVSWFVKTDNVASGGAHGNGATVYVHWYDGNNNWLGGTSTAPSTGTNDWIRKGSRVTSPSNAAKCRYEIQVNNTGTAWYDNVQMELGSVINTHDFLENASFESDLDLDYFPDGWDKGTLTVPSLDGATTAEASDGSYSVVVNGVSGVNKYFSYKYDLQGIAGTPIHFSGFSKSSGLTYADFYQVLLRIEYTDSSVSWHSASFNKSSHDWEYAAAVVNAQKDFRNITLYGKLQNSDGTVWFDDFRLRLDGSSNALMNSYNIVQNPSFERDWDGNSWPDDWEQYQGGTGTISWVSSDGNINSFTGQRMIKISNMSSWAVITQAFPVEDLVNGKAYTTSAVIKTENVDGSGADPGGVVKFNILNSSGTYIGQMPSNAVKGTNDWTRVSKTVTTDEVKAAFPTAAKIQASIGVLGQTSGDVYFDAVRMSEGDVEVLYEYEANGNYVNKIINQLDQSIVLAPNKRGNTTSITNPKLDSSSFEYNDLDQLLSSTDARGLKTEYTYDNNGAVEQITHYDDRGVTSVQINTASVQYNELGLVKKAFDENGIEIQFEYDKNGNLKEVIYKKDSSTSTDDETAIFDYDNANRLTNVSYSKDTTTWVYTYDNNGNVKTVTKNDAEITSYDYDKRNRVAKVTYPQINQTTHTADYSYNGMNQLTSVTNSVLGSEPTLYGYDQSGLNVDVIGPNNSTTAYMYDEQGRLKKAYVKTLQTGAASYQTYRKYDAVGHVTHMRTEDNNGNGVAEFKYEYDENGNIKKIVDVLDNSSYVEYTYDELNQLKTEKYYDGLGVLENSISYTYDLLGNILTKTTGQGTTNYNYNIANEITTVNGAGFTYDKLGNLEYDATRGYTYIYNAANQLVEVKSGSTTIALYEYNSKGLRTKKVVVNGDTEYYYYTGNKLSYIADSNNALKYFFTRDAAGQLLNMIDYTGATPNTYWYVINAHGDIVSLVDKNGQEVVTYEYDTWGNITGTTGTATIGSGNLLSEANPFRYAGYFHDEETELYYLNARYYDSELGRFLTKDIIRAKNLYVYCGNNPINFVDPSGFVRDIIHNHGNIFGPRGPAANVHGIEFGGGVYPDFAHAQGGIGIYWKDGFIYNPLDLIAIGFYEIHGVTPFPSSKHSYGVNFVNGYNIEDLHDLSGRTSVVGAQVGYVGYSHAVVQNKGESFAEAAADKSRPYTQSVTVTPSPGILTHASRAQFKMVTLRDFIRLKLRLKPIHFIPSHFDSNVS